MGKCILFADDRFDCVSHSRRHRLHRRLGARPHLKEAYPISFPAEGFLSCADITQGSNSLSFIMLYLIRCTMRDVRACHRLVCL